MKKEKTGIYSGKKIRPAIYRPFTKQWLYFDKQFDSETYRMFDFFPEHDSENQVICVSGVGANRDFSALMVDTLPDFHLLDSQCFPYYRYDNSGDMLFGEGGRRENIPDETLRRFQSYYDDNSISKWDIFYYVYGLLHSSEYKTRYEADLKKMLPHIPMHKDFRIFSDAGKELGDLHVNYENAELYPLDEIVSDLEMSALGNDKGNVIKMTFGKKDGKPDKSVIVYNTGLTLKGVPPEAYEYIVNGKPALEWIMERYQIKTDKDSQIQNNPNDWSNNPDYIINLIKKIITVSIKTNNIVAELPGIVRG